MRKRKRADTAITVYRYWARPRQDPPQLLWDIAKSMQTLWNRLVRLHAAARRLATRLPDEAARTRLWNLYQQKAVRLKNRWPLNWSARDAVLARFETACREAPRRRNEHGIPAWPKPQRRLERIMIPHRFTGGGLAIGGLFRSRGWRFSLEPVASDAYDRNIRSERRRRWTTGAFGLDDAAAIAFETVLHRPLPAEGWVKAVAWTGKRHPLKQTWEWSVTITVEAPATPPRPAAADEKRCALDLGWRVLPDANALRVAIVTTRTPDGRWQEREIRLPLDARRARDRRHQMKWTGWGDTRALDEAIAALLEAMKLKLRARLADADATIRGLTPMRQGGLIRLLGQWEEDGSQPEAVEWLRQWRRENDRLRSIRSALWDRLVRRRDWIYQNVAADLARAYRTIVIEADLDVRQIAEAKDVEPALKASAKYRQWAAPATLVSTIRKAARKHGAEVVEAQAAWSTVTCHRCGEAAEASAALWLTCPNGHQWDQDVNAARNLYSQSWPVAEQKQKLRRFVKKVKLGQAGIQRDA
jgi:hypothetical protein